MSPVGRDHRMWALPLGLAVLALGFGMWRHDRVGTERRASEHVRALAPATAGEGEFVTSAACRACHPGAYASWYRSFHRTMTQTGTKAAILAPFDGRSMSHGGRVYRAFREGGAFLLEIGPSVHPGHAKDVDTPQGSAEVPGVHRVALVTGSHHLQVYWYRDTRTGGLVSFPFAYLVPEGHFVPNEETLLRPPADEATYTWNRVCIRCHAVAGVPGFDAEEGRAESAAAELGIACEACHGPGQAHVDAHRNPVLRFATRQADEADATIVLPTRLPAARQSEICGQCHGVSVLRDEPAWLARGDSYRAGGDYDASARLVRHPLRADQPWIDAVLEQDAGFIADRFWPDGMVRVGGREWNGLVESPCFAGGQLSCLSCHVMHGADPEDQLRREPPATDTASGASVAYAEDAVCASCHPAQARAGSAHTHHVEASSGSRCQNCHMPHTTYGLLKAMRSHQVDSPSVEHELATGRPNACTLCHLDQPLGFAADHLATWYGHTRPELSGPDETIARSIVSSVAGDAGVRALFAWHLGWAEARATAPSGFGVAILAILLDDPYAAIRRIALRSLATYEGYEDVASGSLETPEARRDAARRVLERDAQRGAGRGWGERFLRTASGRLDGEALGRLRAARDDRPVRLEE